MLQIFILWLLHPCLSISITPEMRMPTPLMGWSTWESFAKELTQDKILANVDILETSGLKDAGYKMIQVDDGWMKIDRTTQWISRVNYLTRPTNRAGPDNLPSFIDNGEPGCLVHDPIKFPNGMKTFGETLHSRGFKYGLYTSGEMYFCDSNMNLDFVYASTPRYNLRAKDAACFISYGIDLLKVDMCKPPKNRKSPSYEANVLHAWRKILPNNISIYNSRYGCLAKTSCGNAYVCPMKTIISRNRIVDSYCSQTSDLIRTGSDMKPFWRNIIENMTTRFGRGTVSRPGFWTDPDYLVPNEKFLRFSEIRFQFSVWCILSAPLLISVDLRETSNETIQMLKNPNAILVNQQYFGDGGDLLYSKQNLKILQKKLGGQKYAILLLNLSGRAIVTENILSIPRLTWVANPTHCQAFNIWTNSNSVLTKLSSSFTISGHDCVFLILTGCTIA